MVDKIALTTDCWTSRGMESFMTVTAHFLDENCNSKAFILETKPVQTSEENAADRHTAEALSAQLLSVMDTWHIKEKVTSVVHDNGSNVKKIGEAVGKCDVPCAAHTLQLRINSGLDVPAISKVLGAASRLVGHFRKSNVATKALAIKQEQMGTTQHKLIQSCKTRWNSTYDMLRRLEEQRWPICAVLSDAEYTSVSDARTFELTDRDWILIMKAGWYALQ
ncbi:Zinc finger BED domain-containing protein 1 [Holothuria leucospilota]|uniref:Zinc finger BED domain-containing protein 1 n=1 Tax=Holothuria leucospilota TaxID=206669 RepID=A0A9Q1CEG8_HOLLE|nr:Zinc finger BED domain-containing protein 1 [Holothuria leucospilota]